MIDSDDIKQFIAVTDSVYPELIILFFHMFPVVNRISPSLTCRAEIVWWYSCNKDRTSVCVQKEIILTAPHIYRILTYIERNIAHDLNTGFVCRFLYVHPLSVENILKEHLILGLCLDFC